MAEIVGYRHGAVLRDLAAVVGLAAAAFGVFHLAPPAVQGALRFDGDLSSPWTLLTGALVHANRAHLNGALIWYLGTTVAAYVLCLRVRRRRWFRRAFVVIVIGLPVVANLVRLAAGTGGPEVIPGGFLDVAAGFVGFGAVALLALVRSGTDRVAAVAGAVILVLAAEAYGVATGAIGPLWLPVVVAALVVAGGVAVVGAGGERTSRADLVEFGLASLVLVLFVFRLFSPALNPAGAVELLVHAVCVPAGAVLAGAIRLTMAE